MSFTLNHHRWNTGFVHKIVIFRALVLGDMLCAVPAFRAIRKFFPHSNITLVGLPWASKFAGRFSHYIDDFIEFPGHPGLPEQRADIRSFPSFIQKVQSRRYDLALQMHGSGSIVNSLIMLFGARVHAGFYDSNYCPDADWFMPFPKQMHEIDIYLQLLRFLDIPCDGRDLEFPLGVQDHAELAAIEGAQKFLAQGPYVCIHPGSRLLTRRWLPERFIEVAQALGNQGLNIVLTGTENEVDLVHAVSRKLRCAHLNLAGKTSLGALAVLLKNSKLLVSNDTGVSHVAAALGVPSVLVVTGSDPRRWVPFDQQRHKYVVYPVDCRPCSYTHCPYGLPCARGVSVQEVLEKAQGLLNRIGGAYENCVH